MSFSTAVGPSVDAYGKYSRASALADYLEVSVTWATHNGG